VGSASEESASYVACPGALGTGHRAQDDPGDEGGRAEFTRTYAAGSLPAHPCRYSPSSPAISASGSSVIANCRATCSPSGVRPTPSQVSPTYLRGYFSYSCAGPTSSISERPPTNDVAAERLRGGDLGRPRGRRVESQGRTAAPRTAFISLGLRVLRSMSAAATASMSCQAISMRPFVRSMR
jgi:hypothetical protein